MRAFSSVILAAIASSAAAGASEANSMATAVRAQFPQILAHRGASGYIPEHTVQAYETAMNLGADYVEPDLCLTKDGVFVALHDVLLDDTTNVADLPQFAAYKSTKVVDGQTLTGWFVSDFTYAETQELRLRQRLAFRTQLYNNVFTIPTLDQIIHLALDNFNSTQRLVGMYIELKHPAFFRDLGFQMPDMLMRQLEAAGFITGPGAPNDISHNVVPIVIQCFDADTLRYLAQSSLGSGLPRVQLLEAPTPNQLEPTNTYWSTEALQGIAAYAQAVGPDKTYFSTLPLDQGRAAVQAASTAGLLLHPWTFRAEAQFIGHKFSSFAAEQAYFFCCLKVAGVFTEFPDQTRQVIQAGCAAYECPAAAAI